MIQCNCISENPGKFREAAQAWQALPEPEMEKEEFRRSAVEEMSQPRPDAKSLSPAERKKLFLRAWRVIEEQVRHLLFCEPNSEIRMSLQLYSVQVKFQA